MPKKKADSESRTRNPFGISQQEILNVSESYVNKLLDDRRIPCHMAGTVRLLLLADLLAFKGRDDAGRRAALAELTEEAEKLGLGY